MRNIILEKINKQADNQSLLIPKKWAFERAGLWKEVFVGLFVQCMEGALIIEHQGWEITNYSTLLKTRELSIGQTTVCTQEGTVNKGLSIKMQRNPGKANNVRLNVNHSKLQLLFSQNFKKKSAFTQLQNPVQHLAAMAFFCLDNSLPWVGMQPTQMRPSAVKSPSGKQCDKLNCKN